jgi:hypothetical protein
MEKRGCKVDYQHTHFDFLKADCINEFGAENGENIYIQACERYTSMLAEADYRNNESIKTHIIKNMYPVIAYYLTLNANGYSKDEAYHLVLKETQKAAHIQKKKNEVIGKFPFAYRIFKLSMKSLLDNVKQKNQAKGANLQA